jgi:radical SAM protein with 4Fe4S-binding SPASM domain
MTIPNNRVYQKHNSFVDFNQSDVNKEFRELERIAKLRDREDLSKSISPQDRVILQQVFSDLLDDVESQRSQFTLTPYVVEELNSFSRDAEILRYLIHRYRYEIYPQQHKLDGFPPYLQIEPASVCNYRCVFCYQTDRSFTQKANGFMGFMSLDLFKRIIDEIEGNIEFISLASRGEPLLCPEIEQMLAYTRGKFLNLKMNTNASMLDEKKCHAILQSGIKTLVFSADAAEEKLYSQLRVGGQLNRVLKNIEGFQKIRATQYPNSQMITRVSGVKFNDAQDIDSMNRVWGELVDQVAFVAYNPWENSYEGKINDITAPCSDLWRRMFVWWDGVVNPCDVDYKSLLSVGNVNQKSLGELWTSEAYHHLREAHLEEKRSQKFPCNRCTVI